MGSSEKEIGPVIGGAVASFFTGALTLGMPGVMTPEWQTMFDVGQGPIGNTLFFLLSAMGIFALIVGRLQEAFGTRLMIITGAVICSFNSFLVAFAEKLLDVYIWGFLNGVSNSFIVLPALTTVQHWFPSRRGLVCGIVTLSFGISAAVMSPIFALMLNSFGYKSLNLIVAATTLLIGVPAAFLTDLPKDVHPIFEPNSELESSFNSSTCNSLTLSQSVQTKNFWFLWLMFSFQGAAGMAMVTLSTKFGTSLGYPIESAVIILTAFNLASGLSRFVMGYMSDFLGTKFTMSITFFSAAFAYFALPYVFNLIGIAFLAASIGVAFGTLHAVLPSLVSQCFGLAHFGSVFGLLITFYGFFSGIIGPSLSGYLLDLSKENFALVFSYLGILCFASAISLRLVIPPK